MFGLRSGVVAVCAALVLGLVGLPPPGPEAGFVARDGTSLHLDGRPLRLVGYNNYRLTSMPGRHECGGAVSDTDLEQLLDRARSSGANVVRTWFFQPYAEAGEPGRWAAFDRVLAAAAERGLKVIPVLTNHWADCESSQEKTAAFYADGYSESGSYGVQSYRAYAADVAARYAGDSTVAFWQLVNEAETPDDCGVSGARILRAFADDMAGVIKSVDSNHLVSLGTIGSGQCGAGGAEYYYVHAGAVDLCEFHDYEPPAEAVPGDEWNGLAVRIDQCDSLDKPLVVGEVGIYRDVSASGSRTGSVTNATLRARAGFFDRKATAQFDRGVDGLLIWSLGPASDDGFDVLAGDPALGVLRRHATPSG